MSPLGLIFLIVLTDLIGFTLVMPLLGPFAKAYGLDGFQIGLVLAIYPACQLVAGPILGRLSDRYGRRPILILSQAGTSLSFLMMGLTHEFGFLLLARAIDGASGGNILVAQAYVADITTRENRSRGLGIIGAAFGLGFVLGPLLGAALLELPVSPEWRTRVPFLVAAAFSTLAWLLVLFKLPESRKIAESKRSADRLPSWRALPKLLARPGVGAFIGVGALSILAFAVLEGTYSLFLQARLGLSAGRAALAFAALGLASAIVQGGLIRPLVKRFGEPTLLMVGLFLSFLGFAAMASANSIPSVLLATLVLATARGLAGPTCSGLLSRSTPEEDQGAVFGLSTSAQTAARMITFFVANLILGRGQISTPYWEAALVSLLALMLAGKVLFASRSQDFCQKSQLHTDGGGD